MVPADKREQAFAKRDDVRSVVQDMVASLTPLDDREAMHLADALGWVRSGAPLFRVGAPAVPPRHLCVYFALLSDDAERAVLLVDHVRAGLWLLPGGHVDDGEDPRVTVVREASEELGIAAEFHHRYGSDPLFLTVTGTRGADRHVDVSLWFVLEADCRAPVRVDAREAREARWFGLDDPDEWLGDRFDPHMGRFRDKLAATSIHDA